MGEVTGVINPGQFSGKLGANWEPMLARGALETRGFTERRARARVRLEGRQNAENRVLTVPPAGMRKRKLRVPWVRD